MRNQTEKVHISKRPCWRCRSLRMNDLRRFFFSGCSYRCNERKTDIRASVRPDFMEDCDLFLHGVPFGLIQQ